MAGYRGIRNLSMFIGYKKEVSRLLEYIREKEKLERVLSQVENLKHFPYNNSKLSHYQ